MHTQDSSIRVFVFEPHRTLLWGLEKLITSAEGTMRVAGAATNWTDALYQLTKTDPQVILLSIMFGDTAVLERIREIAEKSTARILVLIAKRNAPLEEAAVLAGARGVVDSEGPPDRLLTAITKVHEGEVWVNRASVSRLVDCARQRSFRHADPEQRKIATLTGRERQIVATFAKHPGATAKTIAGLLNISAHTARNHLNAVYEKLQVANRVELFDYAHRHRLHEPADMVH